MSETIASPLIKSFSDVEDPRAENREHKLIDILIIAICGVICGADSWVEIEEFGQAKRDWLSKFLELQKGIPSHDPFGRVFGLIDGDQFQAGFMMWVQRVSQLTSGQVIAIDGKQLRRSHDKAIGKDAIHMVSAWASENRLVLGQVKVDEKSNEITAIPQLLDLLEISGCIVTIDAMGCQKEIAQKIIDNQADYVLALKENHPGTYRDVQSLFDYAQEINFADCQYHQTLDKNHGRVEIRRCWTLASAEYLDFVRNRSKWASLQTLALVEAERYEAHQATVEQRLFISSLPPDPKLLLFAVRSHWLIENQLHWVLDVAFQEDQCRIRKGYAAQNFAVLRHIALNLLKHETSAKCGIKAKRLKAGWNENYLLKVLSS